MSRHARYNWEIQKERRRNAHLKRIRKTTEKFCDKYNRKFDDLLEQNLDHYMPKEFQKLRQDLNRLNKLLSSDPEAAREFSFEIGKQLSILPSLARAARKEFEERERRRQEQIRKLRAQASSDLQKFIFELISDINDPIESDFAFDEIRSIQQEYKNRIVEVDELSTLKISISSKVSDIRNVAQKKAEVWKLEKSRENSDLERKAFIEILGINEMPDTEKDFNEIGGDNLDEVIENATRVVKKVDEAIVDEECRRIAVRSIMDSLKKLGFVVSTPKHVTSDTDEVIVRGKKPAGSKAVFRVNASGEIDCKFDNYESRECMKDIDKIMPLLQDIYGIKLSEERILWDNPDRISKSSMPLENDAKGNKNV